ncbi:MAG: SH3 domain-containing protein [Spirochaetota bacterium]
MVCRGLFLLSLFCMFTCDKSQTSKKEQSIQQQVYVLKAWGFGHRLRLSPGFKSEKSDILLAEGAEVTLLQKSQVSEKDSKGKVGSWWKIQVNYNKKEGWAFSAYLLPIGGNKKSEVKEQQKPELAKNEYYITAKGGLRLREEPNLSSEKVGVIPEGFVVTIVEAKKEDITIGSTTGQWTKVEFQNLGGRKFSGWVFGGFLSKEPHKKQLNGVSVSEDGCLQFTAATFPKNFIEGCLGYCGNYSFMYGDMAQPSVAEILLANGKAEIGTSSIGRGSRAEGRWRKTKDSILITIPYDNHWYCEKKSNYDTEDECLKKYSDVNLQVTYAITLKGNGKYNISLHKIKGDRSKYLHKDFFTSLECIMPPYN